MSLRLGCSVRWGEPLDMTPGHPIPVPATEQALKPAMPAVTPTEVALSWSLPV